MKNAIFLLFLFVPLVSAECFSNIRDLPVNCTGTITSDSYASCRTTSCNSVGGSISVLSCNKPGENNPKYFEMYKQQSTGVPPTLCLGTTCISNAGFMKGMLPYCTTNNTPPIVVQSIPGVVTMSISVSTATAANCSLNGVLFTTTGSLKHTTTTSGITGVFSQNISCTNNTVVVPAQNNTNTTPPLPPQQNTTNTTVYPLSYIKYSGNPVGYTSSLDFAPEVAHGEPSGFIENDTLYYWYHTHSPGHAQQRIIAGSTKNPYNMTTDNRYILHQFDNAYAYLEVRRKAQDEYYMFIERSGTMNVYKSTDKVTWSDYCGRPIVTSGAENPSVTWDNNGVWHMVLEKVGATIEYYTSNNGCDWSNQGTIQGSIDTSPYFDYINGTFIMYDTKYDGISKYVLRFLRGNNPKNLTVINGDLLSKLPQQDWEKSMVCLDPADSFIVPVPQESKKYFDKNYYVYYVGDQNQTGLLTEEHNQEYNKAHGAN